MSDLTSPYMYDLIFMIRYNANPSPNTLSLFGLYFFLQFYLNFIKINQLKYFQDIVLLNIV